MRTKKSEYNNEEEGRFNEDNKLDNKEEEEHKLEVLVLGIKVHCIIHQGTWCCGPL